MNNKYYDLLNGICSVLDSRLFVGVPCLDLIEFHKVMSPDIMHYIPVVELRTAIGIVNGAYITGNTAVVIANSTNLTEDTFGFNLYNNIPMFLITDSLVKYKNKDVLVVDCRDGLKGLEKAIKRGSTKIINIIII